VRIAAIEPLAALSAAEADLLRGLLEWEDPDIPEIDPGTLAVYVVTTSGGGYEKVVAPASETLGIGMTVIASDFTATATRISLPSSDPSALATSRREASEEPTLAVASALVPHDHDV
jgi:hypothetical protein